MESEREIIEPVDLCQRYGAMNPHAIGWARTPLFRANLRGWGRRKRWDYWGIVTPTHIVGVVASSLDYAGVNSIFVLDRRTNTEVVNREVVVPFAKGAIFNEFADSGRVSVRGSGLGIDIEHSDTGTRLHAFSHEVDIDVELRRRPGHESLSVVVPWSHKRFQLTVKDVGRPARGLIRLPTGDIEVRDTESFAVLDFGRGKWPYSVVWNWAAASEPGGNALQLGGKWTDGTGSTENAFFADGRLHKISEDLIWEYDTSDWMRPWRIRGKSVDVVFHPFYERVSRTNLGVVASQTHQCFGDFDGWVDTADGRSRVDGLTGWAEEARQRWLVGPMHY